MTAQPAKANAYDRLLTAVFQKQWHEGLSEVLFSKDDLIDEAARIGLRIKNLADVLNTCRSRRASPIELKRRATGLSLRAGRENTRLSS